MPRTFSLARLLLGITAFCLLCGLVVNYPSNVLTFVEFAAVFVPTFAAVYIIARFSAGAAVWASLGAVLCCLPGFLLGWIVSNSPLRSYPVGSPIPAYATVAIVPAIGAMLVGGTALLVEHLMRPRSE